MTTFEVGSIASGRDVTVSTLDGEDYNVRGPRLDPDAQDNPKGLPQVALGFDQLRAIATGGGTVFGFVTVADGSPEWTAQVRIRLATLPEYREMLARYRVWFEENDLPCPEPPTDEEILPLITPVSF